MQKNQKTMVYVLIGAFIIILGFSFFVGTEDTNNNTKNNGKYELSEEPNKILENAQNESEKVKEEEQKELTEINSKRAKPDYIPLIKCWGEITNLEEAIQAADDFSEEDSQMPIVFMDWDKIRYEQAKENVKLISNYQKKTDRRMLKQIARNMVFYQIADHEIYGHYLTYNKISECLGNNSDEFSDYVKGLDLRNIVWYINYYMDYVKENNIQVTLEEMIGEEPEGR